MTGGLGGLGLELAAWLVRRGARHLALLGRRPPSASAQQAIAALARAGASVHVAQVDVARREALAAELATITATMPPLRGVVHAAAVLADHTALALRPAHFTAVFAPKARGAWNLHTLTADRPLDFFVLYSSFAAALGSPGQANYAAANAFLDALAAHRDHLGLPALSVQWGPFSEVGLAAADTLRGSRLADRGVASLTPADGLAALARLLGDPRPVTAVARFDLQRWLEFYPSVAGAPFFAALAAAAPSTAPDHAAAALRDALAAASPSERTTLLEHHLREQAGRVLRQDPAKIDRHASFHSLGLDSLMSLELRNRLEQSLGVKLPATVLFAHPDPTALATHLLITLGLHPAATTPAPVAPLPEAEADPTTTAVAALTDAEADAALAAELAALEDLV